jgi:hypothetical protein
MCVPSRIFGPQTRHGAGLCNSKLETAREESTADSFGAPAGVFHSAFRFEPVPPLDRLNALRGFLERGFGLPIGEALPLLSLL